MLTIWGTINSMNNLSFLIWNGCFFVVVGLHSNHSYHFHSACSHCIGDQKNVPIAKKACAHV